MSVIIDGTNGITSPGGDSAAVDIDTPKVKTSGNFTIETNGSDRVTVTSAGNVGIGTSSPQNRLDLGSATGGNGIAWGGATGTANLTNIWSSQSGGRLTLGAMLRGSTTVANGYESSNGANLGKSAMELDFGSIKFYTNTASAVATGTAFSPTERMRITATGDLLVGQSGMTQPGFNNTITGHALRENGQLFSSSSGAAAFFNRNSNGGVVNLQRSGSSVGSINVTTTSTAYATASDIRLKENIVDAPSASDDIDGIKVRSFDWKADGSHQKYGMVAQELETIAPEAVSKGDKDEDMWGVDYSKLVPMLIKEVQSLRARVAQLEGN